MVAKSNTQLSEPARLGERPCDERSRQDCEWSGVATNQAPLSGRSIVAPLAINNLNVSRAKPGLQIVDQRIVELLREQNIEIARRTVAKYREQLRIQPSSRRKQVF